MTEPSILRTPTSRDAFRWDPTQEPKPSRLVQFARLSIGLAHLANTRREKSMHDAVRPLVTHLMEYGHA